MADLKSPWPVTTELKPAVKSSSLWSKRLPESSTMDRPNFPRLKVLVVDDIASVRMLLRGQLGCFGINDIVEAQDGFSGLETLTRKTVDIVITDLAMRPMDGVEFTRRLRADSQAKNANVPILMVSSHTDRPLVKGALDAGITQFLAKPLTTKALGARLTAIVEGAGAQVQSGSFTGPDRRRVFEHNFAQRRKSDREIV
jgi:two-component system chemotaxis response regulator CheY